MSEINSISIENGDGRAKHPYDAARAEAAVRELLLALGEDPERDGLRDTPARVARAMAENFAGLYQSPEDVLTTTFDIGHEELVIIRDIDLFSQCEHHLTPFHGVAHVGYIPNGKITGLSKVARLVDLFARRPQVQERMTSQIADAMMEIAQDVKDRKLKPSAITEKKIKKYLYEPTLPDVDLFLRTSGEQRTSNFLLWQSAYAEFHFSEKLWPEFDAQALDAAIADFNQRERRFGKTSDQVRGAPHREAA